MFVCFITFLENVFPPSPSDMILVFCGTLVGLSGVGFVPMVFSATLGSILGFTVMYWVGVKFGVSIKHSNSRFLPRDAIERAEEWFQHYGYWIIVANRFLSGTRAVISIFAGMSVLPFPQTVLLSGVSAAVWNTILVGAGAALGNNWLQIDDYLSLYGKITITLVLLVLAVVAVRTLRSSCNPDNQNSTARSTPAQDDTQNSPQNSSQNLPQRLLRDSHEHVQ